MLNSMRSSGSNVFVWIIILLLIVGLAGFGINQSGTGGAATAVAQVGDEPITVDEYVRALNQETRRLSRQFRTPITLQQFIDIGADRQLMSDMLVGATIDNEANRLGISTGDETVRARLMATQAFQGVNGGFSEQAYEFALENAGMTPQEYDETVREETTRQIFQSVVAGGTRTPETAAIAIVNYLVERRGAAWLRVLPRHLAEPVGQPDEGQLSAYYDDNIAAFTLPEARRVTYAAITEGQLVDAVEVSDEDIAALYEERASEYSMPARRLVDRIVFGTAAEADDALGAIQSGTRSFDDIAADRGLSPDDLDLGEIEEGDLNGAERTMLFGTDTLGIVGPVETEFGPALYRVNAVLEASETLLAEVEDELRDEIARTRAADLIAENADGIIDLIAGGATPEEVAAETILELATITLPNEDDDSIAADAAFREEALVAAPGEERDLIDLSDGLAVLRVDEIVPPTVQSLDAVRADAVRGWREAETAARLEVLGQSLAARIDSGDAIGDIAAELQLAVTEEAPLSRSDIIEDTPPAFVAALFEANPGKAVSVPDGQSVLIGAVTEIVKADPASDTVQTPLAAARADAAARTAQDLMTYFVGALQDEAEISVNRPLINNIQSQLVSGGHGF